MLSKDQAESRVAALVEKASKAGADAADAIYSGQASTSVSVRLGALEGVERSEGEEIGLRYFVGHRSASVVSSDLSDAALDALVERAAAMAREAPDDPYAGLAPADILAKGGAALDIDDPQEPDPAQLREYALTAEAAARSATGITNSEGADATAGRGLRALATSHGFVRADAGSHHSLSVSVIAGSGGAMQRDHASHQTRWLEDLDSPEEVGKLAAERALARLNPGRIDSGTMPVVFDPRVGSGMLGHLIGAISGQSIARGSSFLLGRENETVFGEGITIADDPHRARGLRSRAFDGEGLPTAPRNLIEKGRLTGWLADSASARQLGIAPTGHATRSPGGGTGISASNVDLLPGTLTPAELMADIKAGFYVTYLFGQGVNPVTGDYSRGAAGFVIRDGGLGGPVEEITIAGNLIDMFRALTAANDLELRRAMNVPTLRIDGMMVASA